MRLDYQILLKSSPLTLLAGSAPAGSSNVRAMNRIDFYSTQSHVKESDICTQGLTMCYRCISQKP